MRRVVGDTTLDSVGVADLLEQTVLPCSWLFSLIGADAGSDWLSGYAALDQRGFVLTDVSVDDSQLDNTWRTFRRRPFPFETSKPALFAVGDVRSGSTKRIASAVGEGSAAVRSVHQYLAFGQ
jgi:thioredoxin reductase (NADPH)